MDVSLRFEPVVSFSELGWDVPGRVLEGYDFGPWLVVTSLVVPGVVVCVCPVSPGSGSFLRMVWLMAFLARCILVMLVNGLEVVILIIVPKPSFGVDVGAVFIQIGRAHV